MKLKLWITVLAFSASWPAFAQTEKKTALLGASVSFSTSSKNSSGVQLNSLAVGPRVGYFIGNHLAIGMEFNYNLSKLDGEWYNYFDEESGYVERGFGFKEENFGLSPFIRKYFMIKEKFGIFAQGNLTFQLNSYKNIDDSGYLYRTDYSFKGFGSSLNLGFAFFPKRNWGVEFSFPFIKYFNERNVRSSYHFEKTRDFQTAVDNFIPNIGVNFHL